MLLRLLTFYVILSLCGYAQGAEDADYAKQLKSKGHETCAPGMNAVMNWLVDDDAGAFSTWHKGDPNNHVGVMIASKRYSDGNNLVQLTGQRTLSGGCDVTFNLTFSTSKACPSVRETVFKEWKYFAEIKGVPIYDDPTTNNVDVALISTEGGGCVVSKVGVLFYDKEELLKMGK